MIERVKERAEVVDMSVPVAEGPRRYGAVEEPTRRFPVPAFEELPEDLQTRIAAVQEKLGFVPNVFWALAHRPDEFRAFFAYFDALMLGDGGLTKVERELVVVVTTALNRSVYCVAHHGAILRLRARDSTIAERVAINYRRAGLSARAVAMLDFAVKVAMESHLVGDADFDALAPHGFSDEDIWDIGAISAFFAHGSRMANLVGMRPNDEFDPLGRANVPPR